MENYIPNPTNHSNHSNASNSSAEEITNVQDDIYQGYRLDISTNAHHPNLNVNVDSTSPHIHVTSVTSAAAAIVQPSTPQKPPAVKKPEDAPVKVVKTAPGEWKCTEPGCDRIFHRNDRARAHDRLHAGIYRFKCEDKCGRDNWSVFLRALVSYPSS